MNLYIRSWRRNEMVLICHYFWHRNPPPCCWVVSGSLSCPYDTYSMPYLQYSKSWGLGRSRSLELGQPIPSLPGVSTDFVEKSFHVSINQIPVSEHMSVFSREQAGMLLLGRSRGLSSGAGQFRAHHAGLRTEHPPLALTGSPGQSRRRRTRQILSCHHYGTTTGGTAVYFGHVALWQSFESLGLSAELEEHSAGGRQLSAAVKSFIEPAAAATAVSALLTFHQPGSWGGCYRQAETCLFFMCV